MSRRTNEPRPADGTVVYRTFWRADLAQAAAAAARQGIPAVSEWRDTNAWPGLNWRTREGDGEGWLVVPVPDVARARAALGAWKNSTEARVQGHMRDVRWQLAIVLFLGALAIGIIPVIRIAPQQPAWPIAYSLVMLGLGAYVFSAWRKSRHRARS
jgi:hypothetical protein